MQPRIPHLWLTLESGVQEGARIDVNGVPFDLKLLGSRVPFNPGRLKVVAKKGLRTATYIVLLPEGANETLNVRFAAPASSRTQTGSSALPAAVDPEAARPDGTPVSFWAGLAAGGIGLTTGIVFGLNAQNQRDSLRALCPNYRCDRELEPRLNDYNQARITSLVGYGVGVGALLFAGVSYWIATPSPQTALRLSPSGATLEQTF